MQLLMDAHKCLSPWFIQKNMCVSLDLKINIHYIHTKKKNIHRATSSSHEENLNCHINRREHTVLGKLGTHSTHHWGCLHFRLINAAKADDQKQKTSCSSSTADVCVCRWVEVRALSQETTLPVKLKGLLWVRTPYIFTSINTVWAWVWARVFPPLTDGAGGETRTQPPRRLQTQLESDLEALSICWEMMSYPAIDR